MEFETRQMSEDEGRAAAEAYRQRVHKDSPYRGLSKRMRALECWGEVALTDMPFPKGCAPDEHLHRIRQLVYQVRRSDRSRDYYAERQGTDRIVVRRCK